MTELDRLIQRLLTRSGTPQYQFTDAPATQLSPPDLTTGAGQMAATWDQQQLLGESGYLSTIGRSNKPEGYRAPPSYWRNLDQSMYDAGVGIQSTDPRTGQPTIYYKGNRGGDSADQIKLLQIQHDKFLEDLAGREKNAGRLSKPNQANLQRLRGRYAALAEEASEQVGHVSTQQLHLATQSLAHEFNAINWDQGQGHPPNSKVTLEDGSTAMTDGNSQVIGSSIISKDNITDDGRGGYYVYDGKTQSQVHHTAQEIAKDDAELAAARAKAEESELKTVLESADGHERRLNNVWTLANKKTGKLMTPEVAAANHEEAMAMAYHDIGVGRKLQPLVEEHGPAEGLRIYRALQASETKAAKAEADEAIKPIKDAEEQRQAEVTQTLDDAQADIDTKTENDTILSFIQGRQAKEMAASRNSWDSNRIRAKYWTTDPDLPLLRAAAREVPGTGQERMRNLAQMPDNSVVLLDGEAVIKMAAPTPLGYELYPLVENIEKVLAVEDAEAAQVARPRGVAGQRRKSVLTKPRGLF